MRALPVGSLSLPLLAPAGFLPSKYEIVKLSAGEVRAGKRRAA